MGVKGFFMGRKQISQNQNEPIFEVMAKSWFKKAGIAALTFVAYRAYQLYELGNSFSYRFKGMYFRRPKGLDVVNNLIIVLEYVIVNPTKSSLKMNGMYGTVSVKGQQIAAYQSGPFTIKPGETPIKVEMVVNPYFAATTLLPQVKKGIFPVFDATLTAVFPFRITHTEKFAINTKDYIPSSVLPLFV